VLSVLVFALSFSYLLSLSLSSFLRPLLLPPQVVPVHSSAVWAAFLPHPTLHPLSSFVFFPHIIDERFVTKAPCVYLPFGSRRIGEASHPGPAPGSQHVDLSICCANVCGIAARLNELDSLSAELSILQEINLHPSCSSGISSRLRHLGWKHSSFHPAPPRGRGDRFRDSQRGSAGGVGFLSRSTPFLPIALSRLDVDGLTSSLDDDFLSRFSCIAVPVRTVNSHSHIIVYSVYGFTRARSCKDASAQNERLLKLVFTLASTHGPVPVFIMGDFNVTASESLTLQKVCDHGWVDSEKAFASDSKWDAGRSFILNLTLLIPTTSLPVSI
jgi:hypothetical protein